ncbi:hypothetical protein [Nonomuraea monospora]|uniref:hypothetical protein n=1 Tax=Nonomuraea monospora TaxID=568818 RepID=UPI0031DEDC61
MDGTSGNALRIQLTQHGRCYELAARQLTDGRLAIEVNGSDADGAPVAALSGSLPVSDLSLLVDLIKLMRARGGQAGEGQISVVEQQRLAHAEAHRGWTDEQDERLRRLACQPDASVKTLAVALLRSEGAIRSRLRRLRIDELPRETHIEGDQRSLASCDPV